jgi:chemotaxis protein methyltransferase CheR
VPIAPDIVAGVARRLTEHAGFELPTWVVEARTAARIARLGVAPGEYLALLERGTTELAQLVEAVRVGETRLFRHRPQITALALAVAPALRGRARVSVWSAGCAAGEEVATLAAVLTTALPGAELSVIGTDVSAEAIAVAREGSFAPDAWAQIPEEWRGAFVGGEGERVRLRADVAARVTFERANLLDAAPGSGFDIVWCRNVLIYFSATAKRRVIERLVGATAIGGAVFCGYSESLRDVAELEPERWGEAAYYTRRATKRTVTGPVAVMRMTPAAGVPIVAAPPATKVVKVDTVPRSETLQLTGQPEPEAVADALGAMLAMHALETLAIDFDGAELLGDELAPVLRRACAALRAAGVHVDLRASRAGARRWLARHGLDQRPGETG